MLRTEKILSNNIKGQNCVLDVEDNEKGSVIKHMFLDPYRHQGFENQASGPFWQYRGKKKQEIRLNTHRGRMTQRIVSMQLKRCVHKRRFFSIQPSFNEASVSAQDFT